MMNPKFEIGPVNEVGQPRLLLLTHYFPPDLAVGALRWRKLSAFLAAEGWTLDVISNRTPPELAIGADVAADLPPGMRIWQATSPDWLYRLPERAAVAIAKTFAPRRQGVTRPVRSVQGTGASSYPPAVSWDLHSFRGYIRLYLAAREAARTAHWAHRIARLAARISGQGNYHAVITSGPPHTWHMAGRLVSRRTGLPWVMDLRDPWSTGILPDALSSPAWLRIIRKRERQALAEAVLVLTTTDGLRDVMCRSFPNAADKIVTVMNGMDDEPIPPTEYPERFTISYLGAIYSGRDPRPLFAGFSAAIRELDLSPDEIVLRFAGDVETFGRVPVQDLANAAGLESYFELLPKVPRANALMLMARSHMLVSLPWADTLSIPAKIFEYIRFPAWILAFANHGSALERLLRNGDADIVAHEDIDSIRSAIVNRYRAFAQGKRPVALGSSLNLSRRFQADLLIEALSRAGIRVDR
jgi:glycosyltransferase involved in cell wall biosynthesis